MSETSQEQFEDTPSGWASRWQMELKTAREALKEFHDIGKEVDKALRDEKREGGTNKRLCLFVSDTQTINAMLFGRTPQASVSRKFADADDDPARVAADMLERVLNCDTTKADDTFSQATRNAMLDWRGPGLGVQRHRYEVEFTTRPAVNAVLDEVTGRELAPFVPETKAKEWERVNSDWVAWDEFLWGQCRVWDQSPWVAYLAKMPQKALVDMVGKELADKIPKNSKRSADEKAEGKAHPWDRADVWEIHHLDTKQVFWVVEGYPEVIFPKKLPRGEKPGQVSANGGLHDPLGLEGFFSCQKPMMANLTTSKLVPVPDYKFAQDLYNSVDVLTERIAVLAKAARLAGAYDKSAGVNIEQLVKGGENKMYPVENWAMLGEKGGLRGVVDWLPLEQIVATLTTLRDVRREEIDLLYQVTGRSDVMRGQQTANGTPGEAQVKAKFGSVRLQAMQDEIARFASDGQRIRAEIICKHFDAQTIIDHSNVMRTPDAKYAQAAVALLKSPRFAEYRIEVKPEAINLTDFAALKEERFEVLAGIASYMGAMGKMLEMDPTSKPHFLKMLQVTVAGLKGGSSYEAVIDQWIADVEKKAEMAAQNPQPPPVDPKVQAAQLKVQADREKGQMEMAKIQANTQARGVELQMETQAKREQEFNQEQSNVREHTQKQVITNQLRPPVVPKPNGGFP
jgi:hypothetical protein